MKKTILTVAILATLSTSALSNEVIEGTYSHIPDVNAISKTDTDDVQFGGYLGSPMAIWLNRVKSETKLHIFDVQPNDQGNHFNCTSSSDSDFANIMSMDKDGVNRIHHNETRSVTVNMSCQKTQGVRPCNCHQAPSPGRS